MSWDVAVAGGGLAGAAAACHLAEAGRRVVLLERERGPHHKVCGEFWSVEAQGRLDAIAGGPWLLPSLGAAPIEQVRIVCGRLAVSAPLPFRPGACHAIGSTRGCWTRPSAAGSPCSRAVGAAARRGRRRRAIAVRGGESPRASPCSPPANTSCGAGSGRGIPRPDRLQAAFPPGRCAAPGTRRPVEMAMFDGGYAGLQLVEDGLANLCLVVRRDQLLSWAETGAACLSRCRTSPGGSMAASPAGRSLWRSTASPMATSMPPKARRRVYRLGDQAAVIPSFTGDGMAMALHSARLATDAILAGHPPAVYHREFARRSGVRCGLPVSLPPMGATTWLQPLLTAACRLAPRLLTGIAAQTRIRAA